MEPAVVAAIALAILVFGSFSLKAERSPLTPPMFFVLVGYTLSDRGLGWLDLSVDGGIVHGLAELTLVVLLFTDASRIDLACLRREGSLPARLLGLGMPLTIAAGALVAFVLFPGFGIWEALLLAVILAPTDAALGQAVVSSPLVPQRIRQTLNVESGLNDGIALPVVLVFASMASASEARGDAWYWARFAALAVTLGPLAGWAIGWAGGRLLRAGRGSGWINDPFEKLIGLAIAGLAYAGAELIGGNGFIAAFVAGLTLGNTAREAITCIHAFGEAEGQLLVLLVFVIFGGLLLPTALEHTGPAAFVYAVLSLTVVRMLPVALSLIGAGLRPISISFLAWFGPRGLASMLFALLVVEAGELRSGPMVEAVVVLTVALSTFAHGLTAHPLAKRYGPPAREALRRRDKGAARRGPGAPPHPGPPRARAPLREVRMTHSPVTSTGKPTGERRWH